MTFDIEKKVVGRRVARAVECEFDVCGLTFGTAPCTAVAAAGDECMNFRPTCADPANYDSDGMGGKLGTKKVFRFSEDILGFPPGVFPYVVAIKDTPTKINPKRGLAQRETINVQFIDVPHDDLSVDPYVSTRTYDPANQGTFWGKMLARNRASMLGRKIRLFDGYIADQFDWGDFKSRTYFITKVHGPDRNGNVRIEGKDLLSFIGDKQIPEPSNTKLLEDIDELAATIETDAGTSFTAPGVCQIGDEIIKFETVNVTGDGEELTDLTRGYRNTEVQEHSAGDSIQEGIDYIDENAVDVFHDFFNRADVDDTLLNTTELDFEQDIWLSGSIVNNSLCVPTKATTLIEDFGRQFLLYSWWDSFAAQVRFRSISPSFGAETLPVINDNQLIGTVTVEDNIEEQVTRALVAYKRRNGVDSGALKDYQRGELTVDVQAESIELWNRQRLQMIFSDWITVPADAFTLAARLVSRYANGERKISFTIDQSQDGVWVGDKVTLITDQIQDRFGAPAPTDVQILEADQDGNTLKLVAVTDNFTGKYAKYAPDSVPDYPLQSDFQKAEYASYSDDDGLLNGGTELGHRYV